mmetsp:Transcript_4793/g.7377  ORF Transcript_4793/g.7377 Transcript_4793/m.7377 type:complete len:95 (-) Transcript_4793:643-927(-)
MHSQRKSYVPISRTMFVSEECQALKRMEHKESKQDFVKRELLREWKLKEPTNHQGRAVVVRCKGSPFKWFYWKQVVEKLVIQPSASNQVSYEWI